MVRGEDEGEEAFGLSESLNPEIPMNSAKMKQIGDLHGEEKNSLQNTGPRVLVVLEALAVLKVVLANLKVVVVVVVAAAVLVAVQKAWDSIAILKRAILAVPKASEEEVHVEVAEADEVVVALVVKVSETEEENGNLNDIVAAIKLE